MTVKSVVLVVFVTLLSPFARADEQRPAAPEPAAILQTMERAADWQLANPAKWPIWAWHQGAFYAGVMALADISANPKYEKAMFAMAESNAWQPGPRIYHADDQCVGQTYVELFLRAREPRMIAPLRDRFDFILAHPKDENLEFVGKEKNDRWAWCDSLFMAPPAWVRLWAATGDQAYLNFAIEKWWKSSDFLYDRDEHLYFRDSTLFKQREANGKKIFWSRGNGWVMAGIVRILQFLPADHPARARFVQQFREMAEAVIKAQQSDGMWRASLLDPQSYPMSEASGSGFFCYALAWGVNQGLLDRAQYEPIVRKAWSALAACVNPEGKVTHVQPVGFTPTKNFDPNSTEVFGVGAVLLAGSEMYRMGVLATARTVEVTVKNPSALLCSGELVEVDLDTVKGKLPAGPVAVFDSVAARVLPSQVLALQGKDGPQKLIFPVDLAAKETRRYELISAAALPALPPVTPKTHARFVPERMDDFAWESDRIAYRMYGPALIKGEGTVSSGIDVWVKSVRRLVVDAWYKSDHYHEDTGEGLDFYKVGSTRGCGGLGVWVNGKLYSSSNFSSWKVLADGPLRCVFELTYASWDAAGRSVAETKRISLDANSNLNRIESMFITKAPESLGIGIGIAERAGEGAWEKNAKDGLMIYWEPEMPPNGRIACAVVVPGGVSGFADADGNGLALTQAQPGRPFVYYSGAGWSKGLDFVDPKAWNAYVHEFARRLAEPLTVSVGDGR